MGIHRRSQYDTRGSGGAGTSAEVSSHSIRFSEGGQSMEVPRGVYHYTETGQDVQGGFKVPELGQTLDPMQMIAELMQAASRAENEKKSMSGIYVPMPFGMRPLNLQVTNMGSKGVSFAEEASQHEVSDDLRRKPAKAEEEAPLSPVAEEKLAKARQFCLEGDVQLCDQALDAYFLTRFGSSPMKSMVQDARATPTDPNDVAQVELASWLLPSLRTELEKMRQSARSSVAEKEEERDSGEDKAEPPSHFTRKNGKRVLENRHAVRLPSRRRGSSPYNFIRQADSDPPATDTLRRKETRRRNRVSKLSLVPRFD